MLRVYEIFRVEFEYRTFVTYLGACQLVLTIVLSHLSCLFTISYSLQTCLQSMFRELPLSVSLRKWELYFSGQRLGARVLIKGAQVSKKLKDQGYTVSTIESIFTSDPALEAVATRKPSPQIDGVGNEKNTLDILHNIKTALTSKEASIDNLQTFPFFICGDISITPDILSALHHVYSSETEIELIYFDSDVDPTIPLGRRSSSQQLVNVRLCHPDTLYAPGRPCPYRWQTSNHSRQRRQIRSKEIGVIRIVFMTAWRLV